MDVGLSNSTINTGQRSTSIVIVGALRGACFTPGSSRSRATYHGPERVKPVTLSEQDLTDCRLLLGRREHRQAPGSPRIPPAVAGPRSFAHS